MVFSILTLVWNQDAYKSDQVNLKLLTKSSQGGRD